VAYQPKHSEPSLKRFISSVRAFWRTVKNLRNRYNNRMAQHYSASSVAAAATALCCASAVILLFLPRCIGVADDGSLHTIMQQAGLRYRAGDAKEAAGAYFVRTYERTAPVQGSGFSTHILLIRAAMSLNAVFSSGNEFDVRFLALIYLCLYLPAFWFLVKQVALRVRFASEGTVIGVVAVLMFADVSYLAYFNSLYPEAVWLIGLLYCAGLSLSLQRSGRWDTVRLVLLAVFGAGLSLCEQHCALIGFVLAVFCLRQMTMDKANRPTRAVAVLSAAVLILSGFGSLTCSSSRFSQDSKFNAMTSGVLLESTNPQKTLSEFGIDPRFETLTDASSYSSYPFSRADNPELTNGFYNKYSTPRLVLYYAKHPVSMMILLQLGVRAAFNVRRGNCGNYELSAGMPARGRTPLFALFSNFKIQSAPKTLGYLLLLAIVYGILLAKWNTRRMPARARAIALDTFWTILAAGLVHTAYILIRSGTPELPRYCLIFSVCIDLLSLLTLTEILHRLNIFETGEDGK